MAVSDPKHVAAMLVGQMSPHGGAGDEPGEQSEETDPGEEAAAEDMMAALDAKDPHAFASAMKSFMQICSK